MKLKLGVIMDPIGAINYKKDSTLAMLLEGMRRDYELYYIEQPDLYVAQQQAMANMRPLKVFDHAENWYELGQHEVRPLADLDAILMRKDPPFDMDYIYTTYLLEIAETAGTLIVNRPQSLRDCNEKLFITHFPQCMPPTLVSSNKDQIRAFLGEHGDIILKPLDSMGGASIFRVQENDPNINVIIETLTLHGRKLIMVQRYIPEILAGDKRILIVNGEVVPYTLARIPGAGETRANLATGGSGVPMEITEREHWIAEQLKSVLLEKGLMFVGIDVIGDYLTEINVTSPTCIRELDNAYDINISAMLMDAIEASLKEQQT